MYTISNLYTLLHNNIHIMHLIDDFFHDIYMNGKSIFFRSYKICIITILCAILERRVLWNI